MPSKLDPHISLIERWLAVEPQMTALSIVGRLTSAIPSSSGRSSIRSCSGCSGHFAQTITGRFYLEPSPGVREKIADLTKALVR
jgi:hypothetical protein